MDQTANTKIFLEIGKTFSFLEYHTDAMLKASDPELFTTEYSFLKKVEIENLLDEDIAGAKLRLEFSSPLFSCEDLPLPVIEGRKTLSLRELPFINVDASGLYQLNAATVCQLTVRLLDAADQEISVENRSISILPISCPTTDAELLRLMCVKYVITDFPEMATIMHMAIVENMGKPLVGYQNKKYDGSVDKDAILHEVECVYKALHKYGISYANPPYNDGTSWRIRTPQQVLKERLATCLDSSILFCACLQAMGLNSILFHISGHAFAGFFLDEDSSLVMSCKNASEILGKVTGSKQEIVPVETTLFRLDSDASFQQAVNSATESLKSATTDPKFEAHDVSFCHRCAIKPIPIPKEEGGEVDVSIRPADMQEDDLALIRDYQFRPIETGEELNRFSTWEKKLLDLTASNKLVNFRIAKDNGNLVLFPAQNGKNFFTFLHDSEKGTFKIKFAPGGAKEIAALNEGIVVDMLKSSVVIAQGKETVLKKIIRASATARDETGSPTLYLAIGMITDNGLKISAPLLLLPVTIAKDRLGDEFTVDFDFDDLMLNKTFFEYCKLKTGNDYSSVYGIDGSYDFEDIVSTILKMQSGGFDIERNTIFVANFTFSHYVMWTDMHMRREELKRNPVVASLLANESKIENVNSSDDTDLDALDDMSSFAAPLPYDSTQLRAIVEAGKGNSFILDGPPGTGKSQTIVNMIVNAFYQGKTVLFIAEKMAALEVVRNRLEKLGLGRFALELYSSKANKASVFQQLGRSLELGAMTGTGEFEERCKQIAARKSELKKELAKLHEKHGFFYSLFEAISNRLVSNEMAGKFSLPDEFAQRYGGKKDVLIRSYIADIISLANSIPGYDNSPLKALSFKKFDYLDQTKLPELYGALLEKAQTLRGALVTFADLAKLSPALSQKKIKDVLEFYDMVVHAEIRSDALVDVDVFVNDALNLEALSYLMKMEEIQTKYAKHLDPALFANLDADSLDKQVSEATGIFRKGKIKKIFAKVVAPSYRPGYDPELEEMLDIVKDAKAFADAYENAKMRRHDLEKFFGEDILKGPLFEGTAKRIELYKSTSGFFHALERFDNGEDMQRRLIRFITLISARTDMMSLKLQVEGLKPLYEGYLAEEAKVQAELPFDLSGADDYLASVIELMNQSLAPENAKSIASMAEINARVASLTEEGLGGLCDLLRSGAIKLEQLPDTYENALDNAFIRIFFRDPYFNQFQSSLYEQKINSYQKLIQEYNTLAVEEVTAKVTSGFLNPKIDYKSSTPIGALKKLVASGGRGITIRNALEKYEGYFRSYFPAFLMSPLSAAQYLDVNSRKFDIIIFDEASQIPTSEAVGPIARGNALIVAGDPQQMPPTNYFSASFNPDDESGSFNEELQDSESLLDDCISIGMPRIRLCFHYRSKHQSLIEFSNQSFYRGDLFTFPSFDALKSHISFQYVDAGGKETNKLTKAEIDAILGTLQEKLTNPATKGKSIGIIVFNLKQQETLQDEIDKFFDKHKDLYALAYDVKDPLFIKNLENVQGDERDIIILCIGFSKSAGGKAEIRGPLILDKGERRLNVAASRAKEEMVVISTIHSIDIEAEKAKNAGARYLKNFLRFAEEASGVRSESSSNIRGIAQFIQRDLARKGYTADINVGTSGFKIDLAIKEKDGDKYVLGVILDGQEGKESLSVRDRFYVTDIMLNALKWKLVHVYTLDYLRFPASTIESIIAAINKTPDEKPVSQFVAPEMIDANPEFDYGIAEYKAYSSDLRFKYEAMERRNYYPRFCEQIKAVIELESPVPYETIKDRCRVLLGISKIQDKADEIIKAQLFMLRNNVAITHDHNNAVFYWAPAANAGKLVPFRASDRDIMDIAQEEIIFLMNKILEAQQKVDKEDLFRLTAEKIGVTMTAKTRGKLEFCLKTAIEKGLLARGYTEHY